MGLLECASGASVWRGYYYHIEKRVPVYIKTGNTTYRAKVSGNASEPYTVEIDIAHPRKSKCNCPHADGKRIICKHMIALYFTVFPEEAQRFYNEAVACQEEEEKRQEELDNAVVKYVHGLKKHEMEELLLRLLFEGPEWQLDRFIDEYIEY